MNNSVSSYILVLFSNFVMAVVELEEEGIQRIDFVWWFLIFKNFAEFKSILRWILTCLVYPNTRILMIFEFVTSPF